MATLTITTTSAQDARLVKAFGADLGLGHDASGAEIRGAILNYMKSVVHRQEVKAATLAANLALENVTPLDLT